MKTAHQKKCGWIAVIGRPNAGKSTLINALLGEDLSLVSPKAQTTRERVIGILSDAARGQAIFVDTPGVHRAREGGINAFMVGEARAAIEGVDLVCYLVDPASAPEHEAPALELLKDFVRLANPGARLMLVWTKADIHQVAREWEAPHAEAVAARIGAPLHAVVRVCPRGPGRGMKPLIENLWRALPEGPAEFPDLEQVSDRPTRFFVAERVRGAIFRELGEELPYSCAVEITNFDEESAPPRIEAKIHVERESQKGIVIGAGGKKIKAIGTRARGEIEKFLGGPVFLGLTVGVLPDWTRDREKLKRLGFQLPEIGGGAKARGPRE